MKHRSVANLATYVNGYPFKPDSFSDRGTPVVRIKQLKDPNADLDLYDDYVPKQNRINSGDLIFSWSGSLAVARWNRGPAYLNQHLFKVIPAADIDGRWLGFALEASIPRFTEYMHGTAMTHLTLDVMKHVSIPVPSRGEQRRIADFLDDQVARIDNIIAARRRELSLVDLWLTGHWMDLLFDRQLPLVPVSYVANVRLGRQRAPQHAEGAFMRRYLRSANVFDGRIDTTDVLEMNFDPAEQQVFGLKAGDVLVTEGAGSPDAVGASALWDARESRMCFQNTLIRLRAKPGQVSPEYLTWWARTSHRSGAIKTWATGANILHLGSDGAKRMPIPMRSQAEQAVAVGAASTAERHAVGIRGSLTASAEAIEQLKRSLITATVTGKFDVSAADGSRVAV